MHSPTSRRAIALAVVLLVWPAGGCTSTAATPSTDASASPGVSASLEVSASITPAEPTRTKSIVTDGPTVLPTPTAVPTVRALPNLTGLAPSLDPDPPTCNEDFVLDILVTNSGRGPSLGQAMVIAAATRNSDGRIDLKTPMPNVPALAPGASVHLTKTVQITRGGPHTLTMYIDSSLWVAETDEDDNQITKAVNVLYGSCSKI